MNRSPPRALQPHRLPPSPLSQSVLSSPLASAQAGNVLQSWSQPLLDRKGNPSEEFTAMMDALFEQLVNVDRNTNFRTDYVDCENYARYCQYPGIAPVLLSAPAQDLRKFWEMARIPYRVAYDERGLPVGRLNRDDFHAFCVWQLRTFPGSSVEVWNRTILVLKLEQRIDDWRWAFGKLPVPGDGRIPLASPGLLEPFLAWQTSLQRTPSALPSYDALSPPTSAPITPSPATTPITPSPVSTPLTPSVESKSYFDPGTATSQESDSSAEKKGKKDGWLRTLVKKRSGVLASPKNVAPVSPPEPLPPLPNAVRGNSPPTLPSDFQRRPSLPPSPLPPHPAQVQIAPSPIPQPVNPNHHSSSSFHVSRPSASAVSLPSHPSQRTPYHSQTGSLSGVDPRAADYTNSTPYPNQPRHNAQGPGGQEQKNYAQVSGDGHRPAISAVDVSLIEGGNASRHPHPTQPRQDVGSPGDQVQQKHSDLPYASRSQPVRPGSSGGSSTEGRRAHVERDHNQSRQKPLPNPYEVPRSNAPTTQTNLKGLAERPGKAAGGVQDAAEQTHKIEKRVDKTNTDIGRAAYGGAIVGSDSESSSGSSGWSESEGEDKAPEQLNPRGHEPRQDPASRKTNRTQSRVDDSKSSRTDDDASHASRKHETPISDSNQKRQKEQKPDMPVSGTANGLPTGPKKAAPAQATASNAHGWHGWSLKSMVDRVENLAHEVQDYAKEADELEESVNKADEAVSRAVDSGEKLQSNVDDAWQPNGQNDTGDNGNSAESDEESDKEDGGDREDQRRKREKRREKENPTSPSSYTASGKGKSSKRSKDQTQARSRRRETIAQDASSDSSSDSEAASDSASETNSQERRAAKKREQSSPPPRNTASSSEPRSDQVRQQAQQPAVQKATGHHWGVKGLMAGAGKLAHGVEGFADRMHEWEAMAEKAGKSATRAVTSAEKTYGYFT